MIILNISIPFSNRKGFNKLLLSCKMRTCRCKLILNNVVIIVRYFSQLLGEKEFGQRQKAEEVLLKNGNQVFVYQQVQLLEPFARKEVKEAVFSIKITKSA